MTHPTYRDSIKHSPKNIKELQKDATIYYTLLHLIIND